MLQIKSGRKKRPASFGGGGVKCKNGKAALKAKNMSKTKKSAAMFFAAAVFAVIVMSFSAVGAAFDENGSSAASAEGQTLIAAGVPFGVRLHTDGVIIVNLTKVGSGEEMNSPAFEAGLRKGDIILSVGGKHIGSAKALCEAVERSQGKVISVQIKRGGKEKTVDICPVADGSGVYKIGVLARDNAAGIGTITFIDPSTGIFAGLGHGICDADSGELIPVSYGSCEQVELTDIIKGKNGAPGELRGYFSGRKTGKIISNSHAGVFGALSEVDDSLRGELYTACGRGHIHEGKAYIFTTVDGSGRQKYEVNISAIDESGEQKNFIVEITDKELLAKTGGIVQGMSGSPIIQDEALVGAVTHVMISDPTRGYGILIENMLSKMNLRSIPMAA